MQNSITGKLYVLRAELFQGTVIIVDYLMQIIIGLVLIKEVFVLIGIYYLVKKRSNEAAKVVVENTMKEVYQDFPQYKGDIEFLIRHKPGKYIVFIDVQNELEWETKEFPEQLFPVTDVPEISSKVGYIEHLPGTEYFNELQRKAYLTMLGLSLVQAWNSDVIAAKETLLEAEHYVDRRKAEITRRWQLQYCILCGVLLSVGIWCVSAWCPICSSSFGVLPAMLDYFYYGFYGVVGVFLSIIHQSGKTSYDCQSGKMMYFLQIILKYMAGMMAGIIAAMLYGRAINIPALQDSENIGRIIIAIAAGFSERFIPSFIETVSVKENNEKE